MTLGDGVLELTVEDARDYLLVPDVRRFDAASRQHIVHAFQPLLERPIGSIFDEVQREDRRALDSAVLEALGLDPKVWLPRLYYGLTTLVGEWIELGSMRGKARRGKAVKAVRQVAEAVLTELLPQGARKFPDDFWSPAAKRGQFVEVRLPNAPLRHTGHLFGKEELVAEGGFTYLAKNRFEASYLLYAQQAGHEVARLPQQPVEISRTVTQYEQYVRQLRQQLYEAYYNRTLDQKQAARLTADALKKLHLPDLTGSDS